MSVDRIFEYHDLSMFLNKNNFLYKHIVDLQYEYTKLMKINFPDKYTDLYEQLIYTECIRDIEQDLAYATFDPILTLQIIHLYNRNIQNKSTEMSNCLNVILNHKSPAGLVVYD